MIDDRGVGLGLRFAGLERPLPYLELSMGAGAARKDLPSVLNLGTAAERFGILSYELEQLFEELRKRDHFTATEIDQTLIEAVAHRAPAIFPNQHRGISTPTLIAAPQPP